MKKLSLVVMVVPMLMLSGCGIRPIRFDDAGDIVVICVIGAFALLIATGIVINTAEWLKKRAHARERLKVAYRYPAAAQQFSHNAVSDDEPALDVPRKSMAEHYRETAASDPTEEASAEVQQDGLEAAKMRSAYEQAKQALAKGEELLAKGGLLLGPIGGLFGGAKGFFGIGGIAPGFPAYTTSTTPLNLQVNRDKLDIPHPYHTDGLEPYTDADRKKRDIAYRPLVGDHVRIHSEYDSGKKYAFEYLVTDVSRHNVICGEKAYTFDKWAMLFSCKHVTRIEILHKV